MATETLAAFIGTRREELVQRCRAKLAARSVSPPANGDIERGIPRFLDDIVGELSEAPSKSREMRERASRHGKDLFLDGLTVGQVVQEYGSVCQSITDMAVESAATISAEDFRILNKCLDNSIANAVSEYSRQKGYSVADQALSKEIALRNLVQVASGALTALQTGAVGVGGATGALLDRTLTAMRELLAK
jgi:hypothetical protein